MSTLAELVLIAVGSAIVNNVVLSQFLGICPFLGVSKKTETAAGMGGAVILIYRASSSLSNVISVVICAAVGIIVYVLLAFLLRSDELKLFAEKILKKQSM